MVGTGNQENVKCRDCGREFVPARSPNGNEYRTCEVCRQRRGRAGKKSIDSRSPGDFKKMCAKGGRRTQEIARQGRELLLQQGRI